MGSGIRYKITLVFQFQISVSNSTKNIHEWINKLRKPPKEHIKEYFSFNKCINLGLVIIPSDK